MAVTLDQVIPFGRSLDEYQAIFSLRDEELGLRILGVGDGPASFNAEMTSLGHAVTSIDPVYQFSKAEIEGQFNAVVDDVIAQVKATPSDWVWSYHSSPEALRDARVRALNLFLGDYEQGAQQGRYRVGELPKLDLQDNEYDIALCSHFLFLYSDHLSYEFHLESVLEMLRVASEVRIFPLLTLSLARSPYVDPLISELEKQGVQVDVVKVPYELQRGGNEMLKMRAVR